MPKTKDSYTMCLIIDKWLQKGITKEDLAIKCEEASGKESISIKTIERYLKFMQDEEKGFGVKLDTKKVGKSNFYKYKNPSFSISTPLTKTDSEYIKHVITILKSFEGIAMSSIIKNLEDFLKYNEVEDSKSIVSFEHNPFFANMDMMPQFFHAVTNKNVLQITYHPFEEEEKVITFHPYYIKQYNKRWYLFGWDGERITNLGIDRIKKVEILFEIQYKETEIDFGSYFDDIIGVSKSQNEPYEVIFAVSKRRANYVNSNYIHSSQVRLESVPAEYEHLKEKYDLFKITVRRNFELLNSLMHLGDDAIVLSPQSLREEFKQMFEKGLKNYSDLERKL